VAQSRQSVDLKGVSSALVEIFFAAGKFTLSGGGSDLLNAIYSTTWGKSEPRAIYKYNKDKGHLILDQNLTTGFFSFRGSKWDLKLNNDVLLDLSIRCSAGELDFDLSNLNLNNVKLDMGAGETKVNLAGNWDRNVEVWIKGGVGATTVKLPAAMGVMADVSQGLGSVSVFGLTKNKGYYINRVYDTADSLLTLHVRSGIGEIKLTQE